MTPFLELNRQAVLDQLRSQGLKRWWVAEEAGIHKTTLRRWLSGRIRRVSADHVRCLARVLETDPAVLAAGFAESEKPDFSVAR